MAGTPRNIFQAIGEITGNVVEQEAAELAQIRQQEETIATMSLAKRAEAQANEDLLRRQEEYGFDGNLVQDAETQLNDNVQSIANEITNDNVRRRFEGQMKIFKEDYKVKAQAIQLSKHKEKQETDWNQLSSEDTAEIALTGDVNVLNQKIANWESNKDGFFGDVKDALLPETLAGFTKTYVNTQLDTIDAAIASNLMKPEEAERQIKDTLKNVVNNPKVYKMSSADIRTYNKKLNAAITSIKTTGATVYKESIKQQYTAAKDLVNAGKLSPLSQEYQAVSQEYARIASKKEAGALLREQQVLAIAGQGAVAANEAEFARADATRNVLLANAEKAKKAGDLDLANKYYEGAETLKKHKELKQKQFYERQGDFFEDNPTIEQAFQDEPGQAVAMMALKIKGKVNRSTFRPLSKQRSKEIVDILNSTGSDTEAFSSVVNTLAEMYKAPVAAFDNTPAFNFVLNQLELDIASGKKDKDPYTLGEKKALLLRYADDPRNLQNLWNALTVDTSGIEKPRNVRKQVKKKINKFFEATSDLADLDRSTIPISHQAKLVEDVAIGLKANDPKLSDENAAQQALDMTVGKDFKVINGIHNDGQMISVDTPPEIETALKSGYQTRDLMLNNLKDDDLTFPDIYKLDGDRTERITENAIKTYGNIQQINGVYRFYLKFGDEYRPVMTVDDNGQERYIELTPSQMVEETRKVQTRARQGSSIETFLPSERFEI